MDLQKFTRIQQQVVIRDLINMEKHREIARHLQEGYPRIKPDGMTQEEYEEIVIKRCKDYVSNKDRKPYHQIKKGRDAQRDKCIKYMVLEMDDLICQLGLIPKEREKEIELAQVIPLVETIAQLSKDIYNLVFGKVEDDCKQDADIEQEWWEEEKAFRWLCQRDPEWTEILQKRKENGNHGAI